jgi:hypothetical protein
MERSDLVLAGAQRWFKENPDQFRRYVDIVKYKKACFSLRDLDIFCVHYAAEKGTCYLWNGQTFIVNKQYNTAMKCPTKRLFDPFCRGESLEFTPDPATLEPVLTSICQLNFFRWALENGVIDYIEANYAELDEYAKPFKAASKRERHAAAAAGGTVTRRRLTATAIEKKATRHHVEVLVKFGPPARP